MKSFQYKISTTVGMSDNVAGMLVREASRVKSEVILECNGNTSDAKRIFSVRGMNIKSGDDLAVLIEGEDETDAAFALEKFFHDNL